jgi:hypothetical protein
VLSSREQTELRLLKTIRAAQLANDVNKELEATRLLRDLQNPVDRQQELAESKGFGEAALIGAGKSLSSLWEGGKQLVGMGRPEEERAFEQRAYGALQEAAPVATALGESVPYIAAGGAGGVGQGLGRALVGQGMRAGAVGAGMEGSLGERTERALTEGATGALGTGIGRAIGGIIAPGATRAAPAQLGIADAAEEAGYRVLPSSRFESPRFRQTIEGGLEATPGGGVALDAVAQHNRQLLSRHAAEAIGESGELTGDTLLAARSRIGTAFDDVAAQTGRVPVDNDLIDDIFNIYSARVSPMIAGPEDPVGGVVERAVDFLAKAERAGGIDARELLAQQSKIGEAARGAFSSGNNELGMALVDMQDALLSSLARNAPPEAAQALQQARQQWRYLKLLEHGQNVDPVTGTVHPGRLANTLQNKARTGWYGNDQSDLMKGARFLGRVQTKLPTSGTAERLYLQQLLKTGLGGAAIGGGGGWVAGGDPGQGAALGSAATAGLGLVAPHLLARAYLSRAGQRWYGGALPDAAQAALGIGGRTAAQLLTGYD